MEEFILGRPEQTRKKIAKNISTQMDFSNFNNLSIETNKKVSFRTVFSGSKERGILNH